MTSTHELARAPLSKYVVIAHLALKQRLRDRITLGSRVVFFALILFVFSRLWRALDAHAGALDPVESVWYLAVTEWITIPQPLVHLDIERDVRGGEVAYQLTRPTSYLRFKLAQAVGELAASLLFTSLPGALLAYGIAGGLPRDPGSLLLAVPLAILAACFALLCNVVIGLSAFWLLDCSPIYWLWQKATFALGGLMVPLVLYPEWLRNIARVTPFAAMLNGPGSMAFGGSLPAALWIALTLSFWLVLALLLVHLVYRRGVRIIDLHGG